MYGWVHICQISSVPSLKVNKVAGVEEERASLEMHYAHFQVENVRSAQTLSPAPLDGTSTPHTILPELSATLLVINAVSGASASVSILYILTGLRRHPRPDAIVKICLLASLLLAQISQLLGHVVPSTACCTAMLVCTLCFCLAAGLSLTATIQHLSVLQRGGTCKATCHLLVIVLIPLAVSGGYIALDDTIRIGVPQAFQSFPHCWIQDPTKMGIFVLVPLLTCTVVNLYYLVRIAMRCAAPGCMQYILLTQAALLFLLYTVAMVTGILTAFVDLESLH
ncbi:Hypp327 [Branchiostoma lanceolatum]|uniref:Hypp327 protein n=1 Tax=Branchiostoma lanceolatum TaxID=7740 RepID=A0A8J9VZA9_BRALA|nr:Hypp327 [Branchiostoma lanceolatum]